MALNVPAVPDVVIAIRCAMALVFLTAAAGKLRHWTTLQGVLANYRLLPGPWVRPAAYALPLVELGVGLALLAWEWSPLPQTAAAALLAVFATAMGVNLARGRRHIDCGCFQSALKQTLRWSLVARNAAMIAALAVATLLPLGSPGAWDVCNGLCAGCAAFVIVQCLNTLWASVPAAVYSPR